MDRIISEEERLRRAEDILERRRNTDLRISSDNFVKEKSNNKVQKMFIQVLVSLIIYCGVYYIKDSQNEKLKYFIANINSVLEYDVDFKKIYEEICIKCEKLNLKLDSNVPNLESNNENIQNNDVNNLSENNENIENSSEQIVPTSGEVVNLENSNEENKISAETEFMGIGGSLEEQITDNVGNITEEEQMKIDSEYICKNFNIIVPVNKYTVTSRFGLRESTEIISANHKGIDLGAVTGTPIIAAMEGTVTKASSVGDFGNHLKVQNGDITMVYAHCNKLLVKEGDIVTMGQEIAKVGSTGKATGPHLHFEIRREDRAIDPELILKF